MAVRCAVSFNSPPCSRHAWVGKKMFIQIWVGRRGGCRWANGFIETIIGGRVPADNFLVQSADNFLCYFTVIGT